MQENLQREAFSLAHIQAIASAAGLKTFNPNVDTDCIDLSIGADSYTGIVGNPRLDLQIKARSLDLTRPETVLLCDLSGAHFCRLASTNVMVPQILVLVAIPRALEEWWSAQGDASLLRHRAFWLSIRGMKREQATIYVPRANALTPNSLLEIMRTLVHQGWI